jgi:DNA polymerase-1
MDIAVVDIECNGLDVDTVDTHCIVIDVPGSSDAGDTWTYDIDQGDLADGIVHLNRLIDDGYTIAGHNIIEYDIPILRRYGMKDPGLVLDTLVMSRTIYPGNSLFQRDQSFLKKNPKLKDDLRPGSHALKAWGMRLDCPKDEYDGGWETFSQVMLDYCVQDVASNVVLLDHLRSRMPDDASVLECAVASICRRMRLHGVAFNVDDAEDFTITLAARRATLTLELREAFGSWIEKTGERTPKRTQRRKHVELIDGRLVEISVMVEGVTYDVGKVTEFNPASTEHIAKRLIVKHGWKPRHFTETGKPKMTAEVLNDLPYPEAPLLAEYQEIKKIIGYIAEGNNAWLKLEEKGRLHGKVNPTGTVSGRASHNRPNTGNVPTRSKLGHRCRSLFLAGPGKVIVGADASGLQLRGLAHYLAKWDGGTFATQCQTGDIHEYMREATGLYTRDHQKTWTYAKLFGAAATKLGQTTIVDHRAAVEQGLIDIPIPKQSAATRLGRQTLANLGNAIPAFDKLEKMLGQAADRGWLLDLSGRRVPIGSGHIAIAMLLQSFEACIMKQAMVFAAPFLYRAGAEYVLWVHDEFQVEVSEEHAKAVGETMVNAMAMAGVHFNLRVKIDGDYKVGATWQDTH